MKTKSRTVVSCHQDDSPLRYLPLVDLLVDTKTELLELAMRSGLKVFTTMLEEDREAICGRRYAHEPERAARRILSIPQSLDAFQADATSLKADLAKANASAKAAEKERKKAAQEAETST